MLGMELGSPASVIDAVSLPLPHVAPDQLDLTGSNPVPAVATAYLQAQELLIKQRWPKGLFYSGDAAPSTTGPMATSHRKIEGADFVRARPVFYTATQPRFTWGAWKILPQLIQVISLFTPYQSRPHLAPHPAFCVAAFGGTTNPVHAGPVWTQSPSHHLHCCCMRGDQYLGPLLSLPVLSGPDLPLIIHIAATCRDHLRPPLPHPKGAGLPGGCCRTATSGQRQRP